MTTVAVLNQKGGAGKTTLATCLARALQLEGARVLLVDSDPQGSARDWHSASEGSFVPVVGLDRPTLDKDLPAISGGYDWIVIDGAPQLRDMAVSAIKAADVVLIPVQPSPYDIWACADLVDLIKARREVTDGLPKTAIVISRAIKRTILGREVREALEEHGLPIFAQGTAQRVIYANSAASGSTPLEAEPEGEAAEEIRRLAEELKRFADKEVSYVAHG